MGHAWGGSSTGTNRRGRFHAASAGAGTERGGARGTRARARGKPAATGGGAAGVESQLVELRTRVGGLETVSERAEDRWEKSRADQMETKQEIVVINQDQAEMKKVSMCQRSRSPWSCANWWCSPIRWFGRTGAGHRRPRKAVGGAVRSSRWKTPAMCTCLKLAQCPLKIIPLDTWILSYFIITQPTQQYTGETWAQLPPDDGAYL